MRPATCSFILLTFLCGFAAARVYDISVFNIAGGNPAIDARTQLKDLPLECQVNDIAARNDSAPQPTGTTYWGPDQPDFATVTSSMVPAVCNPTAWAWNRVRVAINYTIGMNVNYCHHHSPHYNAPLTYQTFCGLVNSTDSCSCNVPRPGLYAWRGMDCSNFAAWVYNLALGYYPNSGIGSQACSSTTAPGKLLSSITLSKLDQLAPGDLVYITVGKTSTSVPPVRVSHVVLWTGYTVDFTPGATGPFANATLVNNLPSSSRTATVKCMKAQLARNQTVYVLADSTHTGPNYRPFCGWYFNSFSHARRIINTDTTLFPDQNNPAIAYYDSLGSDCMSYWALQDGLA